MMIMFIAFIIFHVYAGRGAGMCAVLLKEKVSNVKEEECHCEFAFLLYPWR